jgi:hypothetical protein
LLEALREPRYPDELVAAGLGNPGELAALLVASEVRGLVRRLADGRYVA